MIKAEIVRRVGQDLNLKDREALDIVNHTIECMKALVVQHGRLEIRDFGVFQVKQRKARVGRNPKNKVNYPIHSRRAITFKSGKEIKDLTLSTEAGYDKME